MARMKQADEEILSALEATAGYFAALAEPTLLRVLRALCRGERTVGQIVEETGVSQPAVSRHLAALHRHRIVARRRDANLVRYRIADAAAPELCRAVCSRVAGATAARPRQRRRLEKVFG